jgi:hypothetical protein
MTECVSGRNERFNAYGFPGIFDDRAPVRLCADMDHFEGKWPNEAKLSWNHQELKVHDIVLGAAQGYSGRLLFQLLTSKRVCLVTAMTIFGRLSSDQFGAPTKDR